MPHIPPKDYRATALDASLSFTSTGKEMLTVRFRLLDLPETILYWRGFFTEKTTERTLESLRACGWTGDDISNVTFPEDNEAILVVKDAVYKEKLHSEVAFVNAVRGPSVQNEMAPNDAKAFAAKMRGAILAYDKANPPAPPKGDIPF